MANGKEFEKLIINNLDRINEEGTGYFIQSPTPFRSVPFEQSYKLIYTAKALCDFVGIYKGLFVLLEAKVISGASFPYNRLKEHQVDQLSKVRKLGGISFILFHIKRHDQVVALSINEYLKIMESSDKKSIHISEIQEKGITIGDSLLLDIDYLLTKSIEFSDIL